MFLNLYNTEVDGRGIMSTGLSIPIEAFEISQFELTVVFKGGNDVVPPRMSDEGTWLVQGQAYVYCSVEPFARFAIPTQTFLDALWMEWMFDSGFYRRLAPLRS